MAQNQPLIGIALMVLSSALLAAKDGLAKSFLDEVNPLQMLWVQYAGSFLLLALLAAPRHGWKVLQPRPIAGQLMRGALSAAAVGAFLWALSSIPLADATAVFMCAPLVVALLAPAVLREPFDRHRLLAIAVGMIGVVVILRPGMGDGLLGYYSALLSGVLFGGYLLANRRLARAQPPLLNVTHNAMVGAGVLTAFAPLFWQHNVLPQHGLKFACVVVLAVMGQGVLITAFAYAPAAALAPYTYTMLVFAALIGFLVFGTVPAISTWLGIALIVGAGLYIARYEQAAGRR